VGFNEGAKYSLAIRFARVPATLLPLVDEVIE
jgi:hypothetical protein